MLLLTTHLYCHRVTGDTFTKIPNLGITFTNLLLER